MIEPQNRDVGSARKLEGKVYALLFYVGTPANPITFEQQDVWGKELLEAEDWLKRQAARYGKELEFFNAAYGMDGSLMLDYIPPGPEVPNAYFFPESVYQLLRFKNGWDVYEFIKTLTDCKQFISLVFCNCKGRSFACPTSTELVAFDSKKFFFESCVIYRYEALDYLQKSSPAGIAHEILHLFGAADLYAHDESEREFENKYRRIYPDSIMLGSPFGLQYNEVDELTATLVGW